MATVDPSEVDRLADELANHYVKRHRQPGWGYEEEEAAREEFQSELRAGFRAAAAVGARTALEDAAESLDVRDMLWHREIATLLKVKVILRDRAATYTPEQEDDNR